MGVFDFLDELPAYGHMDRPSRRLNLRYRYIVEPFAEALAGARVLDLAAYDGRWSYALAHAGAAEVIGVEARQSLIDRFAEYPDDDAKAKVTLICNDIFADLEARVEAGERFKVVALFGIFYHITEHYRLLTLIRALQPELVIVDGEFIDVGNPLIQLALEKPDLDLNSIARAPGQDKTVVGIPSRGALEKMALTLGYECSWQDWVSLPQGERGKVGDYFRKTRKRRMTVVLVPTL